MSPVRCTLTWSSTRYGRHFGPAPEQKGYCIWSDRGTQHRSARNLRREAEAAKQESEFIPITRYTSFRRTRTQSRGTVLRKKQLRRESLNASLIVLGILSATWA